MKRIRAEYRERSAPAGSTSSTVLALFGQRGAACRARAEAKTEAGQGARPGSLVPYDQLKLAFDDMLSQMDGAKLEIDSYLEEVRAGEQSQKAVPPAARDSEPVLFCPECGQQVDGTDLFRRGC